jgi:hypothetical protein
MIAMPTHLGNFDGRQRSSKLSLHRLDSRAKLGAQFSGRSLDARRNSRLDSLLDCLDTSCYLVYMSAATFAILETLGTPPPILSHIADLLDHNI